MYALLEGVAYCMLGPQKMVFKTLSGVGYEVFVTQEYPIGIPMILFVTPIFKEQTQELYAFSRKEEKYYFELLLQAKGVGPKTAFQILKYLPPKLMYKALIHNDANQIKGIPGVGKKMAEQLLLDLKSKTSLLKDWVEQDLDQLNDYQLAFEALVQMGIDERQASGLLNKCLENDPKIKGSEHLVKNVLQNLKLSSEPVVQR
jgi:Holliday junction DNA helicase RuvA